MKSFLMSAISPPSADRTPGAVGTTTCVMPSSAARKQAIIGPAPPNAWSANSRGSVPEREMSLLTSIYMPEMAISDDGLRRLLDASADPLGDLADRRTRLADIDLDGAVAEVRLSHEAP